jgi:hypothetical protein
VTDDKYASLARELADCLMKFARDRSSDDRKQIGAIQTELCKLRRSEIAEQDTPPDEKSPG